VPCPGRSDGLGCGCAGVVGVTGWLAFGGSLADRAIELAELDVLDLSDLDGFSWRLFIFGLWKSETQHFPLPGKFALSSAQNAICEKRSNGISTKTIFMCDPQIYYPQTLALR
jgi:hypothetical protein